MLSGQADAAVHSAKDLQPVPAPGIRLAAIPPRGDPRDALVGSTLAALRLGAMVATGSQRRRAQLAWLRPDLMFQSLRGNIGTRLARVPEGGAIVVAGAALSRLGLTPEPMEVLGTDVMLPQVAQGALAIECRADDVLHLDLLGPSTTGPHARQSTPRGPSSQPWEAPVTCRWPAMPPQLATGGSTSKACSLRPTGAPWSAAAPPGGPRTQSSSAARWPRWSWLAAARNFWQHGRPARDVPPAEPGGRAPGGRAPGRRAPGRG